MTQRMVPGGGGGDLHAGMGMHSSSMLPGNQQLPCSTQLRTASSAEHTVRMMVLWTGLTGFRICATQDNLTPERCRSSHMVLVIQE